MSVLLKGGNGYLCEAEAGICSALQFPFPSHLLNTNKQNRSLLLRLPSYLSAPLQAPQVTITRFHLNQLQAHHHPLHHTFSVREILMYLLWNCRQLKA
ncbi:transcriptional antiterminator [Sesbania bispinosa]|nr:transcriptional antiterminator [Sesbania bispinosa]